MRTFATPRLLLRPLTHAEAGAMMRADRRGRRWGTGFPTDGDLVVARLILAQPPARRFGAWVVERRLDGRAIGGIGFPGASPPDLEIGYGFAAGVQGSGLATEALRTLTEWALGEPEVERVIALIRPTNPRSVRVADKAGFRPDGETDGLLRYVRESR
jgi:RimJ/RimL family protein N-acetyltransferase